MGEASKYSFFLEYAAIAVVVMGMLGHCDINTAQDYNVALGFFLLYATYSQSGRINVVGAAFVVLSLLVDIIIMARFGDLFQNGNSGTRFGLAMFIMNLITKVGVLVIQFFLNQEFGTISFPSGHGGRGGSYESPGYNADQSHLTDVHYQQGHDGSIGSSYQSAATTAPVSAATGEYPAAGQNGPSDPKY